MELEGAEGFGRGGGGRGGGTYQSLGPKTSRMRTWVVKGARLVVSGLCQSYIIKLLFLFHIRIQIQIYKSSF